jgi:HK97 family phage prohead protease
MLTRDFSLRVKALDDSGTFTGYASTYGGPPDLVGDIIEPGASKQAIASQGNGYPLLFGHSQNQPLGLAKVSDSAAGLVVNGSLLMSDPAAQRAYAHLKAGSIKGLSIGYTLPNGEGKVTYGDDGTRTLKEVHLHEVSLVAVPANPRAQVVTVKTLGQIENVLRTYRPGEVTGDTLSQLKGIDAALKTLLKKDGLCECDCEECLAGDCADCSDPGCDDPSCEGTKARLAAEELALLKSFAVSLKSITG